MKWNEDVIELKMESERLVQWKAFIQWRVEN